MGIDQFIGNGIDHILLHGRFQPRIGMLGVVESRLDKVVENPPPGLSVLLGGKARLNGSDIRSCFPHRLPKSTPALLRTIRPGRGKPLIFMERN